MNIEYVKVYNEPKPILLHAWMQTKQQQYKIEILQISKQSCMVSVMICVKDMQRMQLISDSWVGNGQKHGLNKDKSHRKGL